MRPCQLFSLFWIVLLCGSCVDSESVTDIDLGEGTRSLAVPLVNTSIQVTDFENETDKSNVSVTTDEAGRVTINYDGQVVSRDWSIISPRLPFAPFTFKDSIQDIEILRPDGRPFLVDEVINRIEFEEWNIFFQIFHEVQADLSVDVEIPQIQRGGESLKVSFTIPSGGASGTQHITETFPLEGYVFTTSDNEFQLFYDARMPDGTRVEFNESQGFFEPFAASYVEGYLGKDTFQVEGSIVPVDLFSTWISGGVDFENPTIEVYVENSLGLPMVAAIEEFSITTIDDNTFDVESEAIDNGIVLNYPTIIERGETKITEFSFDKTNSNVKELFKQRVGRVNYNIDAVYNPDEIVNEQQFIGDGGAFEANVRVVIPLEGSINDLVLVDTIDLDLSSYEEVVQAELKTLISNQFPLDLQLQVYFFDEQGGFIDSLYAERFMLDGAPIDANGVTLPTDPQVTFTTIDSTRWNGLLATRRAALAFQLNTITLSDSPLWVFDSYAIDAKIGAILEVNID